MRFSSNSGLSFTLLFFVALFFASKAVAQNYERYKPLDLPRVDRPAAKLPEGAELPKPVEDDRILVKALEAVVIVDDQSKIVTDAAIDSLEGIHYNFDASDSLVFKSQIRGIVERQLGQPITLRSINELARDIIKQYRECKQPIVDVVIPEQRITSGTLHIVVIESRVGRVRVKPGCYFDCQEVSRWIECTQPGSRIYEPWIENDLLWLNQNSFRRVSVDFQKGREPGTTDVIYSVKDVCPLRGYVGIDDSGVESLNYGRFFTGFQYGNLFGRGGTLGYQYTSDESFTLLNAHSLNYIQPLSRAYSFLTYGSWAGVTPMMGGGLSQNGESYQLGSTLTRNLIRSTSHVRNLTAGYEFKSTNNNLEFAGSIVSDSSADLFQLRAGTEDFRRLDIDQYRLFNFDVFVGPGGGMTGDHSAAAFNTIRPGTSPDYFFARTRMERADLLREHWLMTSRLSGQVASERLLFSETLGVGGFESIRGSDERAYNADQGWIANFEFGPRTHRWGCLNNPKTLRNYGFIDLGNGYLIDPQPGEDAYTFAMSTGIGNRFQISDRLIARFDYGVGVKEIESSPRSQRIHFGLTWIPGRRL